VDTSSLLFPISTGLALFAPFLFILITGIIIGCYFLSRSRERTDGVMQYPGTSLVVYTLYFLGIALLYIGVSLMLPKPILALTGNRYQFDIWNTFWLGLSITLPSAIGIFLASRSWKKWTNADALPPQNVFVRYNSGLGVLLGGIMSFFWASVCILLLTEVLPDPGAEVYITIWVILFTSLAYLWVNSRIFGRPLSLEKIDIFIGRLGEQYGPYPKQMIKIMLEDGTLLPTDLAWHEGADDWKPLNEVLGFPLQQPTKLQRSEAPDELSE
jgi:hypothetical protein